MLVEKNGEQKTLELKIITTRVSTHNSLQPHEVDDITFVKDALVVPCARGTALEVCSVLFIINHEVSIMVFVSLFIWHNICF